MKYYRPQLGAIDPAVIKFAERLIQSNTVVIFTSCAGCDACKSLKSLVAELPASSDDSFISVVNINPEKVLTDTVQDMRFTGKEIVKYL